MVAQVNKPANKPVSQPANLPTEPAVVVPGPTRYSPEEYLAMEVASVERHEYRDGEIVTMAGGSPNHNQIAGNIYATLNFAFRGQPYRAFFAEQRLWVPATRLYTYPDVMAIDGALALHEGHTDTVTHPVLIVEVLSKSTQSYDKGDKFDAYLSIPSFQEYLLVDQYRQKIQHYVKTSQKKWEFQPYDQTDRVVRLQTIGLDIAIADIYDKVEFAAAPQAELETDREADRQVGPEPAVGSDQPG
jgi:Uma2 family endonuclease